jgi:hypothetical protein
MCEVKGRVEDILTNEVVIRKGTTEVCTSTRIGNLTVQLVEESPGTADEGCTSVDDSVLVTP